MTVRTASAVTLLAAAATFAAPASAQALRADANHSVASFTIKHLVVTSVRGTMKIKSVAMPLQPNSTMPESVDAVIDVASINTSEGDRDKDLRGRDWFDTAKFPTMHFTSTRIEASKDAHAFKASGLLEMHGITKPVTLNVNFGGDIKDDKGVHHYGYEATTTLNRRDFGLDSGGPLVGNIVNVTIDLDMVEPA